MKPVDVLKRYSTVDGLATIYAGNDLECADNDCLTVALDTLTDGYDN